MVFAKIQCQMWVGKHKYAKLASKMMRMYRVFASKLPLDVKIHKIDAQKHAWYEFNQLILCVWDMRWLKLCANATQFDHYWTHTGNQCEYNGILVEYAINFAYDFNICTW